MVRLHEMSGKIIYLLYYLVVGTKTTDGRCEKWFTRKMEKKWNSKVCKVHMQSTVKLTRTHT